MKLLWENPLLMPNHSVIIIEGCIFKLFSAVDKFIIQIVYFQDNFPAIEQIYPFQIIATTEDQTKQMGLITLDVPNETDSTY